MITDVLKQAIAECGLSTKRLCDDTGVARPSVIRFMRGEQTLQLAAADKLAAYLGIECRQTRRRKG